jgi:2-dehydropantoate 2-reductase
MVYASRLSATAGPGREAVLLTRRPAAREALAGGLVVVGPNGAERMTQVEARLPGEIPDRSQDIVILAAKTFDNAELLPVIARILAPDGACVSVQNGVTNLPAMVTALGAARAYQGATGVGGTPLGVNRVLESNLHATWLPGALPHVDALAGWLEQAGLNPKVVDGIERVQWHKLVMAGVSAPVAVLLDMPLGRALARPGVRALLRESALEALAVAAAAGVELDAAEELAGQGAMFDAAPPEAQSSMYNDFRTGRRPELEDLSGYVVRLADELGVSVPITRAVVALVREKFALHHGDRLAP